MWQRKLFLILFFIITLFSCAFASDNHLNLTEKKNSKENFVKKNHNKSWYVSWGYNKDYWTDSDIHISQPALNNDFTVYNVKASDYPGWNNGLFNENIMSPQYNIRIGHFLNRAHTWAIEISFDHTKYNSNLDQIARVAGTINGQPINQDKTLTSSYFYYALHNGANNLMLNFVRRKPMFSFHRALLRIVAIGKFGAGVMLPHPENTILGNANDVGPKAWPNFFGWRNGWWQMGGWTAGLEGGFQLVFHKTAYLELTNKEAYVSLSDIQVYDGRADQTMWLNETICSIGAMF